MKVLPIAMAMLGGSIEARLSSVRATARIVAVIAACGAVSFTFFMAALTIVLARNYGAVTACLVMGAAFAVAALGTLFYLNMTRRKDDIQAATDVADPASAAGPLGATVASSAIAFARGFLTPPRR